MARKTSSKPAATNGKPGKKKSNSLSTQPGHEGEEMQAWERDGLEASLEDSDTDDLQAAELE